jgi:hypothetical protein
MIRAGWISNPARTIPLFAYAGSLPIGARPTPLPRRWPDKRSADVLDYGLDCRDWLTGLGGAIEEFSLAIVQDDAGPVVELLAGFGGLLIAWLSGGTPGVSYVARWTVALRDGEDVAADVSILITDAPALAAPAMPPLEARYGGTLLARDATPLLPACGALLVAATTRSGAALEVRVGGIMQFRGF